MSREAPILILNVDDYDAGRYAVTRALRHAGFTVEEAETGSQALAAVAANTPNLIVLDVNLPDIDGLEIARRLRADPETSGIPILHLSATRAKDADRAEGLEAGADSYLVEPVDPAVLIATVRALLRVRSAEQEKKELLAREREARLEAEAANRARDDFFALLSHELRTPVTSILGWVQYLQRMRQDEPEALDRVLATIEQSARAQARLIDQLLDASRFMMNRLELNLAEVDVSSVVEQAITAVRPSAELKRISLSVRLDGAIGTIVGDAARLQQVVWNLASNAIKFTPHGGRVEVALEQHPDSIHLSVADTGPGIEPEFLPFIFDRFHQAKGAKKHGGLGLGLSLVRHLVELHGGSVAAESEGEGKGARFVVRIPLRASAPAVTSAATIRVP